MAVAPGQCTRSHGPICQAVSDTSKNTTVMGHPPYSPDLAPCDFLLFPKVKSCLKGTHLPQFKRFRQKQRISWRAFQKPRSRTVTSNGSTECRSVWMLKGTTLKVIMSRITDSASTMIYWTSLVSFFVSVTLRIPITYPQKKFLALLLYIQ